MLNRLLRVLLVFAFLFVVRAAQAQPPNCGEYQCKYDDGTHVECINQGYTVWIEFCQCRIRCVCGDNGDCIWEE